MCDVTPGGMSKEAVVCSLTHLRVHPKHPLAGEIRAYQEDRVWAALAGAGAGGKGIATLQQAEKAIGEVIGVLKERGDA